MARARAKTTPQKAKVKTPRPRTAKAKTVETKAKTARTVHAESESVQVVQEGGKWYVTSTRRPELGMDEVTVERAAAMVLRRPTLFTHHAGLAGGGAFDKLVGRGSK